MKVDKYGNVYVTGYIADYINPAKGITIKYSSFGIQQWVQFYDGLGPYTKIALDDSLNVYVIAGIIGLSFSSDYITLKYNTEGIFQWSAVYNGAADFTDHPYAIAIDDSFNVYVTGQATGINTGYDYATVKYNPAGVQQWVAIYHHNDNYGDRAYDIAVDSFHNVYVTGASQDTILGNVLTVKYDINGTPVWKKRYNGNISGGGSFIKCFNNEFIYVGGTVGAPGWSDYLCIKYDSSGNDLWTSTYNAQDTILFNSADTPRDMKIDKAGNVYLTGTQYDGNGRYDDFLTVKFNSDGLLNWANSYNETNAWDDAYNLVLDNNGNVYVGGHNDDNIFNKKIFTVIKYDSFGNTIWQAKYSGDSTCNYLYPTIGIDSLNNIYLSGRAGCGNLSGIVALKYESATGWNEISGKSVSEMEIFPNPASQNIIINLSAEPEDAWYEVYDLTGKKIAEDKIISSSQAISLKNFHSGIYFLRIKEGEKIHTKKMVKN